MSVVGTEGAMSSAGLGRTLHALRDPLLLFAVPVAFALLLAVVGYGNSWPIGFDFRGTLWEPARALLDGAAIYPEPTRDNIVVGNPAVYPPVFIVASVPLALLPVTTASLLWSCLLGGCVFAAMWILGVRDPRCHVLALTSPVTIHGLFFGNLTIVMLPLVALAWRFRDRAWVAGVALGGAVAAKLFVWPLVVWLLLTRRFRAAAWAAASGALLVLGAWAVIGFEGFLDYLTLLRVVQDVYAERSISVSTVAGALGAPVAVAVAAAGLVGVACIVFATWLVGRADGERRAFAVLVAACVLASPIVWPNYPALLFVPIAITWPRLAPLWFFGYATWLVKVLAPSQGLMHGPPVPRGVTEQAWFWSHTDPMLWYPLGMTAVVATVGLGLAAPRGRLTALVGRGDARAAA